MDDTARWRSCPRRYRSSPASGRSPPRAVVPAILAKTTRSNQTHGPSRSRLALKPIFAAPRCSTSRCPTTVPLPTTVLRTHSRIPASTCSLDEPPPRDWQFRRPEDSGVGLNERRPSFNEAILSGKSQGWSGDDADRLAESAFDAARNRHRPAVVLVYRARIEVEDRPHHLDLAAGAGERLADVFGLDPRQLLVVLIDDRRPPPQLAGTVARRHRTGSGKPHSHARPPHPSLPYPGRLELGEDLLRRRLQYARHRPRSSL